MVELKPVIFGILLAGLFALALIQIGILLPYHNNAPISIGDDPTLSTYKDDITTQLSQASTNSNGSIEAIGTSPLSLTSSTGVGAVFDAVGGIWKTLTVVPKAVYDLTMEQLLTKVLGDESYKVVLGVMAALLIMVVIFGVIKLVAQGEAG